MFTLSRRELLKTAAMAAAAGAYPGLTGNSPAYAKETIDGIGWGGDAVKGLRAITERAPVDVSWQTFPGSTATFLTKIKATWPDTGLDIMQGWDPTFLTIAKEGWAEPVTVERVPHLADVSPKLLIKDAAGNVVNVPTNLAGYVWAYREDITPFKITRLDDLLDPRLKGKVLVMPPSSGSNLFMLTLALHRGGNERNMEPGWGFMKELAKSGNVGRVAYTDIDVTNSISSGETSICFAVFNTINKLPSSMGIRYLTKLDKSTGFVTFFWSEGFCILKSGKTDAAFKFADFALSPEQNSKYCDVLTGIPANTKATAPESVKPFAFSNEEMDKYAYIPDFGYLNEKTDEWTKRWETEVQPLL